MKRTIWRLQGDLLLLAALGWCWSGLAAGKVVLIRKVQREPSKYSSQRTIDEFVGTMRQRIEGAGLSADTLDDGDVTLERLKPYPLAVLPYNPGIPKSATAALRAYVEAGGKLALFYCSSESLLRLVGVSSVEFMGGDKLPSLKGVRFDATVLAGAPEVMAQRSWCMNLGTLTENGGATVAATWLGEEDKALGLAAATVHANGFTFGHVLLNQDPLGGTRLMLAVLGRYMPDVWREAAEGRLARIDELVQQAGRTGAAPEARGYREEALREKRSVLTFLHAGRGAEACAAAERAEAAARSANLASLPPLQGELRGAWIHSGYGIKGWTWDETVKVLADNGFNAIFPNLCWGGIADYPSEVLPVHPRVAKDGDQLAECLRACRKYGLELHVWKVCWNLGHHTPPEIRKQFVEAGRTQVDIKGKPSNFLAPHIAANFELERDAMLEIVRRYDVDGVHFDYIRYPNADCDFSDSARVAFQAWHGETVSGWPKACHRGGALRGAFNTWRRGNISRLVQAVSEGVHAIRPEVQVSAAVFGNWDSSPGSIAQATVEWIDNGWLDFVCPMNYNTSDTWLRNILSGQLEAVRGRIPIYCGLGSWRHENTIATARQIALGRELGVDGFVCFQHGLRFARDTLPGLGKGITRGDARPVPHAWTRCELAHPRGAEVLGGSFRVGEAIKVRVRLDRKTTRSVSPDVTVERDGLPASMVTDVRVRTGRRTVTCTFSPTVGGRYRVLFKGGYQKRGSEEPSPLFVRSRTVDVLSHEDAEERILRTKAPRFQRNGGVRVAVWDDHAYGGTPLLEALASRAGLDVASLYNLRPSSLSACDVVILPQPRRRSDLFRDAKVMEAVIRYLAQGGSVLTTHAMVGLREFVPIAPGVATGVDTVKGRQWCVVPGHPGVAQLGPGPYESTFVDRAVLTVGADGTVLARTPEGVPVVAAGAVGRGRYVACGLGTGIGRGDKDVPLPAAEVRLMDSAVRWLAGD
ncbi:MAG: family 10 glycosylhydrolase [Lentisphaerae bacterium]|jgi:uncharacterized lipoprotein YddW (UPF0748 family)|nr:family 10 glycosylhydrolase [Lentisphaerota bacterium]MBT5608514.1 family 10 glycosylhydrolase [Lentisphaerota bacterium]MBT7058522.1 family 10 glycosylhydrolase [Lentisphaerota bacterium]MBT7843231.1 family 10 glycosylhydrolase [Lentisphaerota bacterium]